MTLTPLILNCFIKRRPGDMMVMHVMSGNRWDVCYRVIDTDSGDEREGTSKALTERLVLAVKSSSGVILIISMIMSL